MKRQQLMKTTFCDTRWSNEMTLLCNEFGTDFVAEMIGVDRTTVINWANGKWTGEFHWPSMHNFLKACDELDLDPTYFFVLEDVK